jgi:Leucine-rich repeat (LRR) protein
VNLRNLEDLDLSNNVFKCQMPSFFGNLCKLKALDLSGTILAAILMDFWVISPLARIIGLSP